jgi:hypothetical protein
MAASDIANGLPVGGSGGSSATSTAWTTLRDINYAALSDADINTAATHTIDGLDYLVVLPTSALGLAVGATHGGIKISPVVATAQLLHLGTRNAPHVRAKLSQFLAGTAAEGRADYEIRISAEIGYEGTINGAAYESLMFQLTSPTYNAGPFEHMLIGTYTDNNNRLESVATGSLAGAIALDAATTPALTYYPPCIRMSILQGARQHEYSGDGQTLTNATWQTIAWRTNTAATDIPRVTQSASGQNSEWSLLFGVSKYGSSGTISAMILKRLIIEGRPSPGGGLVLFA